MSVADPTDPATSGDGLPEVEKVASERFSSPLKSVLFALVLYKAAYFGLMFLCVMLLPNIWANDTYVGNHIFMVAPEAPPIEHYLVPWDAGHYLAISVDGYQYRSLHDAFYPLWPAAISAFSIFTGGDHIAAGTILANLLTIAALVLLYKFLSEKYSQDIADRTIVLLLACPGAIFLSLPYSEPLFLLLSTTAIIQLNRDNYWGAGAAAYLSALSRPTGVLWAIPMAVDAIKKKQPKRILFAGLPICGFLTYLLIMKVLTGDPLTGFHAQSHFMANSSVTDLINIGAFVRALLVPPILHDLHSQLFSPFDRFFFLLTIPLLWKLYKVDKTMFAYAAVMTIVPVMTVKFEAYMRYAEIAFPVFLVVAIRSVRTKAEYWFYAVTGALFVLQVIMLIRQLNFRWVG